MEDVLRTHVAGTVSSVPCPLCAVLLQVKPAQSVCRKRFCLFICALSCQLVDDLVPEMVDPVHARSDYSKEMEELRHIADGGASRVFQVLSVLVDIPCPCLLLHRALCFCRITGPGRPNSGHNAPYITVHSPPQYARLHRTRVCFLASVWQPLIVAPHLCCPFVCCSFA
jgi:hypothetical protein